MAIAIDASTPNRASATGALTIATSSFTAPSGAVLVACVSSNTSPAGNPTLAVTDSGGLTWTQRVLRQQSEGGGSTGGTSAIFTAVTASSASRTVTATASGSGTANGISVKCYVVTGADTTTPTGATAEGASQTNNTTTTAYVSTVNNSRGFACGTDWNELGVPTSTDTGDGADISGQIAALSCYKAADTATSGTSVTFNLDAAGTGTPDWTWVALEILPSSGAATNAPATEATATGSGQGATIAAGPGGTEATASGAAQTPAAAIAANSTDAAATGAANSATAALAANAAEATATATALGAVAALSANAAEATAAGTAGDPTVSTSSNATANAGLATASGTAHSPLAGQVLFTTETPSSGDLSDGTPGITTATSLTFAHAGQITAVRFYSTATVSGTYTAGVWEVTSGDDTSSGTGTLLTSETLSTVPNAGEWTAIPLTSPVDVATGTLYRIGVHNDAGRYVATSSFGSFVSGGLTTGDLTAPADGTSPTGLGRLNQGTFTIDAALAYPQQMFNQACYFVDALFSAGAATDAAPSEAAATGTAHNAAVEATAGALEAAGVGTAEWDAGSSISLDLAADNPVDGVGIAYDATVSTSSSANPTAPEAAGTGTALTPATAAGVPAATATGTGAAHNPSVSTAAQASPDAVLAAAAGVAADPIAAVQVLAAAAAAVAEALDPSVLIGGPGAADAGAATGTGAAYGARTRKTIPRPFTGTITRPFTGTVQRP